MSVDIKEFLKLLIHKREGRWTRPPSVHQHYWRKLLASIKMEIILNSMDGHDMISQFQK